MGFWTQPDQIYYAQMAVSVGTCHLLAYEYYHIKAYANSAILALNGAFFQQCINKGSINELKALGAEEITRENLSRFFNTREIMTSVYLPEAIKMYISKVLPLRYQKMLQIDSHASQIPGMGYVDLISDDWNTTSHGSNGKPQPHRRNEDEGELIKIILSNQESGVKVERTIKNSTQLKTVFNAYAEEYGESLRALRFSYNGSTLFLSSLGQKTASDIGMQDDDVICIYNNSASKAEDDPAPQTKSKKKKSKSTTKKAHMAREKSKSRPQIIVPKTEKEMQEAHSLLLYKVHEEAEPQLKSIRQKLNELSLDRQEPKNRRASTKTKLTEESAPVCNPNTNDLGGKAGKTAYAVNVGRVENLYISSKRIHSSSRSSMSRSSIIDLHGCDRGEAIQRLDSSLNDWMDMAMTGEYPFVIPAVIVCGGGNQILSETVETWIKGNKNVANAPRGHLLSQ